MGTEADNQDWSRNEGGNAPRYVRASDVRSFWRAIAGGGFLAVIVSLFIALGVSYRDFAQSIASNLENLGGQWNERFHELDKRVREIERWIWGR